MFSKCINYLCPIRVYCYRGNRNSVIKGETLMKGEYDKVTGCENFIKIKR